MAMVGPDVCGFIDTARGTPEQQGFTGMVATALSDHEYEELCNRCVTLVAIWHARIFKLTLLDTILAGVVGGLLHLLWP